MSKNAFSFANAAANQALTAFQKGDFESGLPRPLFEMAQKLVTDHGNKLAGKPYLALGESCTGGLVAGAITAISGSSSLLQGGVVSYDNLIKTNQLNVPASTIDKTGAVSAETALAMVDGLMAWPSLPQLALSVTGVAGPGQSENKPAGLVWIAVKGFGFAKAEAFQFHFINADAPPEVASLSLSKDHYKRAAVRQQACAAALALLLWAMGTRS